MGAGGGGDGRVGLMGGWGSSERSSAPHSAFGGPLVPCCRTAQLCPRLWLSCNGRCETPQKPQSPNREPQPQSLSPKAATLGLQPTTPTHVLEIVGSNPWGSNPQLQPKAPLGPNPKSPSRGPRPPAAVAGGAAAEALRCVPSLTSGAAAPTSPAPHGGLLARQWGCWLRSSLGNEVPPPQCGRALLPAVPEGGCLSIKRFGAAAVGPGAQQSSGSPGGREGGWMWGAVGPSAGAVLRWLRLSGSWWPRPILAALWRLLSLLVRCCFHPSRDVPVPPLHPGPFSDGLHLLWAVL